MKVVVSRKSFVELVKLVASVVPKSGLMEPYRGIILTATEPSEDTPALLTIRTSTVKTGMRVEFEGADVVSPGECFVDCRNLIQALEVDGETLVLETDGERLDVRGSEDVSKLFGLNLSEARNWLTHPQGAAGVSVSPSEFGRLFCSVAYAVAITPSRYAVRGVFVEFSSGALRMTTTDGCRLATGTIPTGARTMPGFGVVGTDALIAAKRALKLIPKALETRIWETAEGPARSGYFSFAFHGIQGIQGARSLEITGNCIEGTFPTYQEVIPTDNPIRVTIEREPLISACKAAMKFAGPNHPAMRFVMDGSADYPAVELSVRNPDRGEWTRKLRADYNGTLTGALKIAFNSRYISELCQAVDAPYVTLELRAPDRPLKLTDGTRQHVLLPVTLSY